MILGLILFIPVHTYLTTGTAYPFSYPLRLSIATLRISQLRFPVYIPQLLYRVCFYSELSWIVFSIPKDYWVMHSGLPHLFLFKKYTNSPSSLLFFKYFLHETSTPLLLFFSFRTFMVSASSSPTKPYSFLS